MSQIVSGKSCFRKIKIVIEFSELGGSLNSTSTPNRLNTNLSVDEHNGAKQTPCSALPINVQHAQNLQKSDAAYRTGRKHLPVGAHRQDDHRGDHND